MHCGLRVTSSLTLGSILFLGVVGCGNSGATNESAAEQTRESLAHGEHPGSCLGASGAQAAEGCWCDDQCERYGDCCVDKSDLCDQPIGTDDPTGTGDPVGTGDPCNAATSIGQCDELDGCAWTDSNTGVGGLCHVFTCPYPEPDEFALNPNIHPLSDCTQPVCRKDIFSGVTCNYESECHDPGGNWESCTAPTSCEEAIQRTECEGIDGCEWYDSPDFTVEKSRCIIKPPFTCPEQPAEPGFGCIPKNDGAPYCRQDRETKNQCVYDNSCLVPYHLWEACNPTICAESENDAQCLTIPGCVLKDVYSSSLGFVTLCIEGP